MGEEPARMEQVGREGPSDAAVAAAAAAGPSFARLPAFLG